MLQIIVDFLEKSDESIRPSNDFIVDILLWFYVMVFVDAKQCAISADSRLVINADYLLFSMVFGTDSDVWQGLWGSTEIILLLLSC